MMFYYYHFPYTYILTEYSQPICMGLLNIRFNTHSSIFYLASLFTTKFKLQFVSFACSNVYVFYKYFLFEHNIQE